MVRDIDREAAVARADTGHPPLSLEVVLSQDPHHRPERLAKSPALFVHAVSKAARLALYEAYAWFVAAYRAAGGRRPIFIGFTERKNDGELDRIILGIVTEG